MATFQKLHDMGLNDMGLNDMGLSGAAMGMINYVDDFPHKRDELLPRMERTGLREKR